MTEININVFLKNPNFLDNPIFRPIYIHFSEKPSALSIFILDLHPLFKKQNPKTLYFFISCHPFPDFSSSFPFLLSVAPFLFFFFSISSSSRLLPFLAFPPFLFFSISSLFFSFFPSISHHTHAYLDQRPPHRRWQLECDYRLPTSNPPFQPSHYLS